MTKTIEETYQKKTPKEHILLRPDTYIGSTDKDTQTMFVWDEETEKIIQRTISYVPGLYKIFDEILVNAADNKIRDPKMNKLKVNIYKDSNEISILNNGKGIPIKIHSKENVYVPELIFGHLLTSSNYDDNEKKVTGGRNGYGAKLCNIFSTKFIVETADGTKKYTQCFSKNMGVIEKPVIENYKGEEYTKITFFPDLERFNMESLDEDIISLMKRRVYDMSATIKNVNIYLNNNKLDVKGFKGYTSLYLNSDEKIVHQVINDRWELAFTVSEDQFSQVSFVNSIATSKGGTHVNHVVDQLIDPIIEAIKKKEKGLVLKPIHVKNSMFIFLNCLVENPSFDSQTKENLTLKFQSFGSKCQPVDSFVKEIIKNTNIVEKVVSFSKAKQSAQLKKTDGTKTSRLSGIPKLEDANFAGTKKSSLCTLILTEGDSAKTLAVSGLSVVGRDLYGVFPLRGKLLNVREANHQQIMSNAEISNIKKILGLQHGKTYDDVSSLRYGHVMIMTDQDHDGSHIKGLIINFLDHFFPSLLKIPDFLQEFITPIIRATKKGIIKDFFTIPEYEAFKENEDGWNVKYYKGLGTSTPKDAKQYFSNLNKHVKSFFPISENDRSLIDLAFNKKKADQRKEWLSEFVQGTYLDQSVPQIYIHDFVNKELILFSMADNIRSIPSLVDGLKPGQRKVLFSCFKKNLRQEIKVAQLVGYVSEQSAYHHGEASLCSTIINLAHDFVGSNNINLLLPLGSFGSRLQGGKDAASSRYIYTSLNPLTRLLFSELDDPLLNYLNEDNLQIEPEFYVPILPMVLVNGADGIGTGWSTSIPNYDPIDIINNIRRLMKGEDMIDMIPFYRNFRGSIAGSNGKYSINGIHEQVNENSIEILELPIGTWTQTYKEYLESLLQSGIVKDYKEYHTEKSVDFLVTYLKEFSLKLNCPLTTGNMICFNSEGKIKRYNTPLDIIREFYEIRLNFYVKRKENRLGVLRLDLLKLENRVRFIKEVTSDELIINKRLSKDIIQDLSNRKYEIFDNYEYLLGMKISSLTKERIEKLEAEHIEKKKEYENLLKKTPFQLWDEDLTVFENDYLKVVKAEKEEYDQEIKKKVKSISKSKLKIDLEKSKLSKTKNYDSKSRVINEKVLKTDKVEKKIEVLNKVENVKIPKEKFFESAKVKSKKIKVHNNKESISSDINTLIIESSSEDKNPWDKYKNYIE